MKKILVEEGISTAFASLGWRLETVANLPPAFVRQSEITPFFQPKLIRQSERHHIITGFVGFISRSFEQVWQESLTRDRRTNSHCLALNVTNIAHVRAAQDIQSGDKERTILFCNAVTKVLSSFPHDQSEAKNAFLTDMVGTFSLKEFAIFGREQKFSTLREFILRLPN